MDHKTEKTNTLHPANWKFSAVYCSNMSPLLHKAQKKNHRNQPQPKKKVRQLLLSSDILFKHNHYKLPRPTTSLKRER